MAFAPGPELITVEFDGTVTAVTDSIGYLNGDVSVGDAVNGLFVYDETVFDEQAKPDLGRYRFSDSSCMVTVNAGLLLFASDSAAVNMTIRLTNDKKTNVVKDQFDVKSTSNRDALSGVGVADISILLVDETASALSSDALAGQRPDAATWFPTRTLTVTGVDGWVVEARINLIYPADPTNSRKEAEEEISQQ